jgi:hypothetical protein
MSLHRERGPMVVDDLRELPRAPLVVAEGSTLPAATAAAFGAAQPAAAAAAAPGAAAAAPGAAPAAAPGAAPAAAPGAAPAAAPAPHSRALWLIPTPAFQRDRLAAAGRTGGRGQLDALLRDVIAQEAAEHDVPVLSVDGKASIAETLDVVERAFAGALAEGPCARTRAERRALLREANQAIVAQVRGYHARPWAQGDPEAVLWDFVCECGDTACTVDLPLTVGEAAAAPALAPGHG